MNIWKTAKIIRKIIISMKFWRSLGLSHLFLTFFVLKTNSKCNLKKKIYWVNKLKKKKLSMKKYCVTANNQMIRRKLLVDQHHRLQIQINKLRQLLWWRLQWHPHRWHLQWMLLVQHVQPVNILSINNFDVLSFKQTNKNFAQLFFISKIYSCW